VLLWAGVAAAAITVHGSSSETAPSSRLVEKAHAQRVSAADLAISGDLDGLPPGSTRYLSREDLLTLPLVTYRVNADPNFTGPTEVSGIPLGDLVQQIASIPESDLAIAICSDQYHAHYPRKYLTEHHPLLVLKVNGQPPERWPRDSEGNGESMGPYMITHPSFIPGLKVRAYQEEAQIPWGVTGLEFRNEKRFFGAIAPQRDVSDPEVEAGYKIAQQNCLRCHNMGDVGGQKADRPWLVLSAWAAASPLHFADYVRNPRSQNPHAAMPPNPSYDDETLRALTSYFRTFQYPERP